jgi:AhpD family alkylhydroperoxidase
MRASQINGCAFCLDIHSIDARAEGDSEQRLYTLNAWAETPFFTDRERAALAWTEAATNVSQTHVPDEVFEEVKKAFQRKGNCRSDAGCGDDQSVEPRSDIAPLGARPLSRGGRKIRRVLISGFARSNCLTLVGPVNSDGCPKTVPSSSCQEHRRQLPSPRRICLKRLPARGNHAS